MTVCLILAVVAFKRTSLITPDAPAPEQKIAELTPVAETAKPVETKKSEDAPVETQKTEEKLVESQKTEEKPVVEEKTQETAPAETQHIENPQAVETQQVAATSAEAPVNDAKTVEVTQDQPVQVHQNMANTEVKGNFIKPFEFSQSLLVCNAFSFEQPAHVEREENDLTGDHPINYKECRYLKDIKLQEGQRLDFKFAEGVGGIFEVTDLPRDDAVLLLVLQRRDAASTLLVFKSFAFPRNSNSLAQVAVIDTIDHLPAQLVMKDHQSHKEILEFNRVYAIEAGDYDADVTFGQEHLGQRAVHFDSGRDYVLLRTGTGDIEGQDLVVFSDFATVAGLVAVCMALFF